MAAINVADYENMELWREKFNLLSQYQGDLALLIDPQPDLVTAINDINSNIADNNKKLVILATCLS